MSTATMTQADKKKAQEYKMPKVGVGDVVLWHPDGDSATAPWPIVVTMVGPRTINGMPVGSNQERLGIRHVDDPSAQDFEFREGGAWEHTELTQTLHDAMRPASRVPMQNVPPKDAA
jgi:hypothetical protein